MRMIRNLMFSIALTTPVFASPLHAQTTTQWERMDAEYAQCVDLYRSRGFSMNYSESTCYAQVYRGEGDPPTGQDFDPSGYYYN